jgi:hypothetical protein
MLMIMMQVVMLSNMTAAVSPLFVKANCVLQPDVQAGSSSLQS